MFAPYHITHLDLHQPPAHAQPAPPPRQGQYLVFWWQEIALGHLFIEPGQVLSAEAYATARQAAIAPAVAHYAAQAPAAAGGAGAGAQWLAQGDFARWDAWLATILAPYLAAPLPAQVPVSVVICTRGRAEMLRRCLQMLQALPCTAAEIVVVDNAPTDTSTREVAAEFAGVVYVCEPRPGLDVARNTGIRAAKYPVLAFVDDDVVVHPRLLYTVWEAFEDPHTAALTGLVLTLKLQTEAQLIFEQYWSFNRGYVDKAYTPAYVQPATSPAPPVWEIGAGANMAFRKAIFDEVGYFDERLDAGAAGCNGDSEMWYRILLHGHTIRYNPRAIAHHEHRRELAGLKHQLFQYMRGHAAAALIQQAQQPQAGYRQYLYRKLPQHYYYLLRTGFPFFRSRSRTIWAELRGLASGVAFYYRHQHQPAEPRP
ncbi:glycosyltransferase [Hymenobacter bucti]|uniref:Glycosyltransferase n=1 Tax=Hymenobacter bucti TaxID=1844114 RepID=A0ABW4QTU4_9BACT